MIWHTVKYNINHNSAWNFQRSLAQNFIKNKNHMDFCKEIEVA